ncbi:MAG: B12-binding domain-containing protein [Mobilicoccus sp.]|nr:B12-binding domain-containing protein [Mobilicoccus sp.]
MTTIEGVEIADLEDSLLRAASDLDTARIHSLLDDTLERHDLDEVVVDILVPVLHRVGHLWEQGHLSVMAEHSISGVTRSVIADVGRRPPTGSEPVIVLACPPGELHDLPTHLFAAMLRARGWHTIVLGANVPWTAIARTVRSQQASACIIASMRAQSLTARGTALARMGAHLPIYIAGPAASASHPQGVTCLPDDWRAAADIVSTGVDLIPPSSSHDAA